MLKAYSPTPTPRNPLHQNVTVFGDKTFKDVIKVKQGDMLWSNMTGVSIRGED